MVRHTCNPSIWKLRQEDQEILSSKPTWATKRDLSQKKIMIIIMIDIKGGIYNFLSDGIILFHINMCVSFLGLLSQSTKTQSA
jgi:hypothetical protein